MNFDLKKKTSKVKTWSSTSRESKRRVIHGNFLLGVFLNPKFLISAAPVSRAKKNFGLTSFFESDRSKDDPFMYD